MVGCGSLSVYQNSWTCDMFASLCAMLALLSCMGVVCVRVRVAWLLILLLTLFARAFLFHVLCVSGFKF